MKKMWADMAAENAEDLKDFYCEVFGWTVNEFPMQDEKGKYSDYAMIDKSGEGIGGVCHKRGVNKDFPPQWVVYFTVEDINKSIDTCKRLGGTVIKDSKNENGDITYALLKDPSGAIVGVIQEGAFG